MKSEKMSFFKRCCTKKSHPISPMESPTEHNNSEHKKTKEQIKEIENKKRLYNENHFSSGIGEY